MSQSRHVLIFGTAVTTLCIGGAVALAYAPGEHEQSVSIRSEAEKVTAGNILLGTALPAGIAAAAGAFQGTQQNQQAETIVTGELRYGSSTAGVGSDAPELP